VSRPLPPPCLSLASALESNERLLVGASMGGLLALGEVLTASGMRIWAGLGLFALKLSKRFDLSLIKLETMRLCFHLRLSDLACARLRGRIAPF
jgi:hypothetical protein